MSTIIDGSAGITTNAGGSVNPSTNVEGINYSCRGWVTFNGTGTPAINASGNVTSITDNGAGDYTLNFTTAFSDVNYAVIFGICGGAGNNASFVGSVKASSQYGAPVTKTTSACRIFTNDYTSTARDFTEVYVSIFR